MGQFEEHTAFEARRFQRDYKGGLPLLGDTLKKSQGTGKDEIY